MAPLARLWLKLSTFCCHFATLAPPDGAEADGRPGRAARRHGLEAIMVGD